MAEEMIGGMRRERLGSWGLVLFALLLLGIGGRMVAYEHLLTYDGQDVLAQVVDTGSVLHQSGGYVNYIEYRFTDAEGVVRDGRSSGYSGTVGETVRVQYSRRFPFVHRLSGAENKPGYEWRWWIVAAGGLSLLGGIHSLLYLRHRRHRGS